MISVKKDYNLVPKKLRSTACQDLVRKALEEKNRHQFNNAYYSDQNCRAALEELYRYKCAYCETDSSAGAPFQIDHFRPKKQVKGVSGHLGYYWLGYEWSNLLLSCARCNNKKSNKFPIQRASERIYAPELTANNLPTTEFCRADGLILSNEHALILNPELDTVEDHFVFRPDGKISALTERATATIEALDLNRERLVFRRKQKVKAFFNDTEEVLAEFIKGGIDEYELKRALFRHFKKLITYQKPEQEYARLGYFMSAKFKLFAKACLGPKDQEFVTRAFASFINQAPA